jgi:hypothetical protein
VELDSNPEVMRYLTGHARTREPESTGLAADAPAQLSLDRDPFGVREDWTA